MGTRALLDIYRNANLSLRNIFFNGGQGEMNFVHNPYWKPANNPWTKLADDKRNPTLVFTGQQAGMGVTPDQFLETVSEWPVKPDGFELCAWGGFVDIDKAATSDDYCRELVQKFGPVYVISTHLETELIYQSPINRDTFEGIASDLFEGVESKFELTDEEEGLVSQRAIERVKIAARAAGRLQRIQNHPVVVVGFTGSKIFHLFHNFPGSAKTVNRHLKAWGGIWKEQILPTFVEEDVCFALEIHPGEMAFDLVSAIACLEAVDYHPHFGFNLDPSHPQWMGANAAVMAFILDDRIFFVHGKGTTVDLADGMSSLMNGYLNFDHPLRGWRFEAMGLGNGAVLEFLHTLRKIGYRGPVSGEWESVTRSWKESQGLMVHCIKVGMHGGGPEGRFDEFDN